MIFASSIDSSVYNLQNKYAVITENFDAFMKIVDAKQFDQITEQDTNIINEKSASFIEDAHKFIDDVKAKGNASTKKAEIYAYITLGLSIAAMLATIPAAISMTAVILSIILLVASLITMVITIVKSTEAINEYKKITEFKTKLITIKSKTNDKKIKNKIDSIIERIDSDISDIKFGTTSQ